MKWLGLPKRVIFEFFENERIVIGIIILLAVFLRFFHLHELPADTFGDMVENIEHVQAVRNGTWRLIYGFDGREGLFFYLAAASSFLLGNTYFNLKFVTATAGILTVLFSYLFVRQIAHRSVALITAFLIATSKWALVYSRIGFRTVLTPLFVSIVLFFFFRAIKTRRQTDVVCGAFFLGLGLYTYTAFKFVIISVFLMSLILMFMKKKQIKRMIPSATVAVLIFTLLTVPQIIDMSRSPNDYLSHPGPMILVEGKIPTDWWQKVLINTIHQFGMFTVKGDAVSRINPPYEPALDSITGIFFLIGFAVVAFFKRKKEIILLLIPFVVVQLSSILVINFPNDVPSATRTTGILPVVFFFSALGLDFARTRIKSFWMRRSWLGVILIGILFLNMYSYFYRYPQFLPNRNVAFDRVISHYFDQQNENTAIYLVGGAWGDAGQPHPRAILYSMRSKHPVRIVSENVESDVCPLLDLKSQKDFFVVINPHLTQLPSEECFRGAHLKIIKTESGDDVCIVISSLPIE